MSHLTGCPCGPGQEDSIGNDTGADAGAKKYANHVVGLGFQFKPMNADRGHITVVTQPDRTAQLSL